MSNPTELPIDLIHDFRDAINIAHHRADHVGDSVRKRRWQDVSKRLEIYAAARRAQPEGEAPQAEPVMWKLVPVNPTLEMIAAMQFAGDLSLAIGHAEICKEAESDYAAMLSAAPKSGVSLEEALYALDLLLNKMDTPGLSGQRSMAADVLKRAATLSPLCGAQKAESGALDEEEAKLVARGMERLHKGIAGECRLPPAGWYCTRLVGHDGPCAAFPVAAQQAAAPVDCSGTPSSCPDNEGYGCHCSAPGTPEAPAEPFMYAISTPNGKAYFDEHCVDTNAEALEAEVSLMNQLHGSGYRVVPVYTRAAQLDGGQEGSAT